MTPSSQPPLSKWIFLTTDVVLLATAWLIAAQAERPLSNAAIFAVVACVIAGAIVATIPLLLHYEREKNQALDERQQALEALAATVANSAEQISVAASGLHHIAELTQKNLRHAEQLPHKLQDKIAEFQSQLANADDTEKEELEQELTALRTSESERLESISDKIAKSTAEWAKLEAAAQKNLSAAHDSLLKSHAQAATALEEKLRATFAKLDDRLHAFEKVVRTAPASSIVKSRTPGPSDSASGVPAAISSAPTSADMPPLAISSEPNPASPEAAKSEGGAHPPKRPRKPRRENPPSETSAPHETATSGSSPGFPPDEPPPVKLLEITPVAPGSASPYETENVVSSTPVTTSPLPRPNTTTALDSARRAGKRGEKKPNGNGAEPILELESATAPANTSASVSPAPPARAENTSVSPPAAAPVAASTSDGTTRLLITAYIGIGNRLFLRGDGPGLTWEKGVPLQFVSIGKWRWETADATAPVKFKLYKNDELECAAVGLQTLAPGHQQEFAATF